ncbi:hypothetical protein [Roseivivax sp. CAU 1761]
MTKTTPTTLIPIYFALDDGGGFGSTSRPIDRLTFGAPGYFDDQVLVTSDNLEQMARAGLSEVGKLSIIVTDTHVEAMHRADAERKGAPGDVVTTRLPNGNGLVVISETDLDFGVSVVDLRCEDEAAEIWPHCVVSCDKPRDEVEALQADAENDACLAALKALWLLEKPGYPARDSRGYPATSRRISL